jgi:hypothetical protein
VAGYYSATQQHNAAAPLADFLTAAPTEALLSTFDQQKTLPRYAQPLCSVWFIRGIVRAVIPRSGKTDFGRKAIPAVSVKNKPDCRRAVRVDKFIVGGH